MVTRRHPAGSNVGGQFAPLERSEPSADLIMSDGDLIDAAGGFGGKAERTHRLDADDIRGEIIVRMLEARRDRVESAKAGKIVAPVNEYQYISGVARAVVTDNLMLVSKSGPNVAGWKKFCQETEGKNLTMNERERIAEEVRLSFPPERRPVKGYHRQIGHVDISRIDLGDTGQPEPVSYDWGVDALLSRSENGESKAALKRDVWMAVSDVPTRPIPRRAAQSARKVVDEAGGVHELVQQSMTGSIAYEDEMALLAPFDLGDDGRALGAEARAERSESKMRVAVARHRRWAEKREEVMNALSDHSAYAEDLWASAMRKAESRDR